MWDSCLYSFRRLQNSLSTLASLTQTGIWQTTQLLSSKLWQQSLKRYMKYKVKLFTVHHRHSWLCALVCFGLGFFWLLSLKLTTAWMIENVLSFHKLHAEHNYPKYILQSLYTVTHKNVKLSTWVIITSSKISYIIGDFKIFLTCSRCDHIPQEHMESLQGCDFK